MARFLKNFHKNVLPKDYKYLTQDGQNPIPTIFYEALAWRGLRETGVEAYQNLSEEKKLKLDNMLQKILFFNYKELC